MRSPALALSVGMSNYLARSGTRREQTKFCVRELRPRRLLGSLDMF
jgi:hypothetical protein